MGIPIVDTHMLKDVWYVHVQNWVIDVGQMLTDIPNMEHMGYDIVVFINYDYDILWLCVLITLGHYYVVLHMSLYHLVI